MKRVIGIEISSKNGKSIRPKSLVKAIPQISLSCEYLEDFVCVAVIHINQP